MRIGYYFLLGVLLAFVAGRVTAEQLITMTVIHHAEIKTKDVDIVGAKTLPNNGVAFLIDACGTLMEFTTTAKALKENEDEVTKFIQFYVKRACE